MGSGWSGPRVGEPVANTALRPSVFDIAGGSDPTPPGGGGCLGVSLVTDHGAPMIFNCSVTVKDRLYQGGDVYATGHREGSVKSGAPTQP